MMHITTRSNISQPVIDGRFNYMMHLFDGFTDKGTLYGSIFAPNLHEAVERIQQICTRLRCDQGNLNVFGPFYTEKPHVSDQPLRPCPPPAVGSRKPHFTNAASPHELMEQSSPALGVLNSVISGLSRESSDQSHLATPP